MYTRFMARALLRAHKNFLNVKTKMLRKENQRPG
jgi:hypothetical protein